VSPSLQLLRLDESEDGSPTTLSHTVGIAAPLRQSGTDLQAVSVSGGHGARTASFVFSQSDL